MSNEQWIEEAFAVIELGARLMPQEQFSKWRGVRAALESCPINDNRVTELRKIIDEYLSDDSSEEQAPLF